MSKIKLLGAVICAVSLLISSKAFSQDAHGAQTMQILPIVVDTASFKSRISLLNPYTADANYSILYVPADGTAQATNGPLNCPAITVTAGAVVGYPSIRDLCPSLAIGNNFGYLEFVRSGNNGQSQAFDQLGIHVFSRVSNPSGQALALMQSQRILLLPVGNTYLV
jgi:hypothetical protein